MGHPCKPPIEKQIVRYDLYNACGRNFPRRIGQVLDMFGRNTSLEIRLAPRTAARAGPESCARRCTPTPISARSLREKRDSRGKCRLITLITYLAYGRHLEWALWRLFYGIVPTTSPTTQMPEIGRGRAAGCA